MSLPIEDGEVLVNVKRSALPNGAATEATQLLVQAKTDNIPPQGQALAAASLPVVLTAAQEAALTPPAAIAGFALAATQKDGSQTTQIVGPLRTNRVDVGDSATEMEALPDQNGAGAVLTFTFASAVQLVWVRSVGDISRAVVGAQTPTATLGAYCADDEPNPITVNGSVVKVFAPVGAIVSVWGYRYS